MAAFAANSIAPIAGLTIRKPSVASTLARHKLTPPRSKGVDATTIGRLA